VGRDYWREKTGAPIHVIPNIVPAAQIESAPAEVPGAPDGEIILFAGRLAAEKNVEALLEALPEVLERCPATAVFCGEGPARTALESTAVSLGIAARTRFVGAVPNVWSWMKRASVVVSPTVFEGDPNVVLEAIAAGTPLVVSDIVSHRALLNETMAWLVDPRSPRAIAAALHAALSDRGEARNRAQKARAAIASRSPEEIAARYVDVFGSVVRRTN
jgi:glycosyltransferase involved in cell wall biosynthesis